MWLNRSKTWAVVLLLATFVAGLAVGVGGRALWVGAAYGRAPDRARGVDRLLHGLDSELRLTPGQRDSVRAILDRHWAHMSAAWEAVRPRFDSMRAETDSEVIRQLTPDQQLKYRDYMARHRHHKKKADSGRNKR